MPLSRSEKGISQHETGVGTNLKVLWEQQRRKWEQSTRTQSWTTTARGGMRGHGDIGACNMVGHGTGDPSWRDVCAPQTTAHSVQEKHLAGPSTTLSTPGVQEPIPGQALPGPARWSSSSLCWQLDSIHHQSSWSPAQLTRGHLIKTCELQ